MMKMPAPAVMMMRTRTSSLLPSAQSPSSLLPQRTIISARHRTAPAQRSRLSGSLFAIAALLGLVFFSSMAHAKSKKNQPPAPAVRFVEGNVVSHAKVPVENAIVYLEDPKSMAIKSYLTDSKGYFHFTNLAAQTDYEIWAEQEGVQSKHKFISQFSSRARFAFTLKLDPKQKKKFLKL